MAKIYVASRLENADAVRHAQALCLEYGHELTYDWTPHFYAVQRGEKVDLGLVAAEDLEGVLEADALILLSHPGIKGALVEVGAALATGARVVVVGDPVAAGCDNVFLHLPEVVHLFDMAALAAWLRRAR